MPQSDELVRLDGANPPAVMPLADDFGPTMAGYLNGETTDNGDPAPDPETADNWYRASATDAQALVAAAKSHGPTMQEYLA